MKYPLKIMSVTDQVWKFTVVDANHKVIMAVAEDPWAPTFARFVVRLANRWHYFRPWFRKYSREDWLWEKDIR